MLAESGIGTVGGLGRGGGVITGVDMEGVAGGGGGTDDRWIAYFTPPCPALLCLALPPTPPQPALPCSICRNRFAY